MALSGSRSTSSEPLPGGSLRPRVDSALAYLNLTKPRLLPMVLFTGLPVLGLSAAGWPAAGFVVWTLLAIALTAASANTLNAYVERDMDARMDRTRTRPLPAGEVTPQAALGFGLALGALGTLLLAVLGGAFAAALGVASILFYVFVYTIWLKPRSAWNTVVGAAAGAAAPLLADAAMRGSVGEVGLSLFAIVFFWQPPHVWAIALYRKDDYDAAGVVMLPSVIGADATRNRMLAWTLVLFLVSMVPVFFGWLGAVYAVVCVLANGAFIASAIRTKRLRTDESARQMFRVSLMMLFALFLAMNVEVVLRGL